MTYADAIGTFCAGTCFIYFVVLLIYTAIDMKYLPGMSFLAKRSYDDEEE
jgi:hypothetical protein